MFLVSNGFSIGGLKITFYAICILLGAICAYKLSQLFLKRRGYDPEAIENLFYIAFPAGIVGARIWYVIATWADEFADRPFYKVFYIWEGGLAIQGGVILGIIAGVIFMILRRPNIPALLATDCIVPTILVAQGIGRWGNFFNQEVYGKCVDSKYWSWLPNFIEDRFTYAVQKDNGWITGWAMNGDSRTYLCQEGQLAEPLFLIESLINIGGFLLIAIAIPKLFKFVAKKTNNRISLANGDLMCLYIVWYGVVRAIMEPLRDPQFIMGDFASKYMAYVFIVVGIIGIVLCHLYKNLWQKKKPVLDTNVIPGSEAADEAVNISEVAKEEKEESKENFENNEPSCENENSHEQDNK